MVELVVSAAMNKHRLIVTSYDPNPNYGSEPGKAFAWAKALSQFYEVHLICCSQAADVCRRSGQCEDWIFHPLDIPLKPVSGLRGYIFYRQWCQYLIPRCLEVIRSVRPVGLHHPTMGSFRMFPDYFRLRIPYTLGPLGGGETAPLRLLRGSALPPFEFVKEIMRPGLNYACLLNPQVRYVIRKARMVLATTEETEHLLKWAGAKATAVVFPDRIDLSRSPKDPMSARLQQREGLRQNFRCIWSGRFLWWKGGQLAIRFVHRLRQAGCNASLDIYSDGKGIERLKQWVKNQGLEPHIRFNGTVARNELLEAYLRSHLFVYPTLHDSSSSAIPEAYSTALPSFTLGLGGMRTATDPQAGFNQTPHSITEWFEQGTQWVKGWMASPDQWLAACAAAHKKSHSFSLDSIVTKTGEHLCPCFDNPLN
jgi:glycosyltransferase involved in cell wall biosynthesis